MTALRLKDAGLCIGGNHICRVAVDQVARKNPISDRWVRGIGVPERIGHRVQVIQVAEILIEAMDGGQVLVKVAKVVLPQCR